MEIEKIAERKAEEEKQKKKAAKKAAKGKSFFFYSKIVQVVFFLYASLSFPSLPLSPFTFKILQPSVRWEYT